MSLKNKEVLLIDDDSQYQFFMNNILSAAGMKVIQAKTYDEAIKKLNDSVPHLIITDIDLDEDKTGIDIQCYIKTNENLSTIPVFVISSSATKSIIFQSLALGAQEFIIKPVVPNDLIQKLRRLFLDYKSPEVVLFDNDTEKFKEEFVNLFEGDFDIEINTDINLRAVNELSCILQGPVKFPKESVVDLENDLMNEVGGQDLGFRSIENSRTIEAGEFSTRFSLVGIDETTAKRLRTLRVPKK